jgi:dipeptidyl-peptidase 4
MKRNSLLFLNFLWLIFIQPISFAQAYTPLSVSNIYNGYQFFPKSVEGMLSMADGENYTVLENNRTIASYDYQTGHNRKIMFDLQQLPEASFSSIDEYTFSKDEKKLLIATGIRSIYRFSSEANYWIYDLVARKLISLTDTGKQQLAMLSPDAGKVAFVQNNNLFFKDLATNQLVQITKDGLRNQIINGAPDWVYEEEFGFSQGYCWSPDSRYIAFYRFDESQVKEFDMTLFEDLYPYTSRFKYPKAGETNSAVSIHVYDTESKKITTMDSGSEPEQYIPRIKWSATPGKLCIVRLNRLQNKVEVTLADVNTGYSEIIFKEENKCFISRVDDNYVHFLADGENFIILSERSGFYHYYLYSLDGNLINHVTQGNFDVNKLLAVDEKNKVLYYSSNQSSVVQMDLYSVKFDGTCLTRLSQKPGTNDAEFSTTFKYYINTWSSANNPPSYTVNKINGDLIRILEDNAELQRRMKEHGFTKKEFIKIPTKNGVELYAYIIKPPDFDSARKYPLFISVYGGPESQDVTDSWDNELAWNQLLAQNGIVVACIDNRGTDGRGEAFRKSTYLQLGKLETEDQVSAAIYLGNKSWIDEKRIGIWGWSYGGYMTLLCLTKGAGVFKTGVAVAPVVNWRFYDTIYTERFMRTPQENPNGYDDNSPVNHAGELKGKLLLIHGTADDNVHLQNSMEMAEKLIKENKQFEMFLYPDKNHSISGGNTRFHLYSMITEFILKNL